MLKLLDMEIKIFKETMVINKIWRVNSILYLKMLKATLNMLKKANRNP